MPVINTLTAASTTTHLGTHKTVVMMIQLVYLLQIVTITYGASSCSSPTLGPFYAIVMQETGSSPDLHYHCVFATYSRFCRNQ